MEMLSAEYGWTPDQIRAQRVEDISAYLNIIRVKRMIQKYGDKRT
jgi:hypothetical protein